MAIARSIALVLSVLLASCTTSSPRNVVGVAALGPTNAEVRVRIVGFLYRDEISPTLARLAEERGAAARFVDVTASEDELALIEDGECVEASGIYVGYGDEYMPTGWLRSTIGWIRALNIKPCGSR